MSIYKIRNEKHELIDRMWDILLRATADEKGNFIDDAGCDWFTIGNNTFINNTEWHVSSNPEVAGLVNAINSLNGFTELVDADPKEFEPKYLQEGEW